MATTHIFAIGRINGGKLDVQLAPRQQLDICNSATGCHCHAYTIGYDDAKAGNACESLKQVSAVCCIERYTQGFRDASVATLLRTGRRATWASEPADGALQGMIDYAAELQELEDGMADREFWASGRW